MDLREINRIIDFALKEDIGEGDHTSLSCIKPATRVTAGLMAKDQGIVAGVELAGFIFRSVNSRCRLKVFIRDGKRVNPGDVVFEVSGPARAILKAERVVLNFMQRMSGIATATRKLVEKVKGTGVKITDTRKTTPCLRLLEKWAVRIGGGTNHRFGLYDMILIKDNHVDITGGIKNAIVSANNYRKRKKILLKIEIEVRNITELKEALKARMTDRILADNFSVSELKKAVRLTGGKVELEASGGINEKNIRSYARTGVDFISIGAITHSVKSLDMSLKVSH